MKTKLIKLAALTVACIMFAGVIACNVAVQNNPSKISIGSVGDEKYTLMDYLNLYESYAPYANYLGSDLNTYIKNSLISNGAQLSKCKELNITLNDEEKQQLKEDVEAQFKTNVESMTVDQKIEGEEAIYAAKLEAFKKQLKDTGYTEESFKKQLEDGLYKTKLLEKLREQESDIEFGKEQVETYFNEHKDADKEKYENDVNAFKQAFESYLGDQGYIPLYNPEGMFTVKQVLVQYENTEDVTEEVEGVFNEEINNKINEIRDALENGISLEDFVNDFVSNKDYNNDPVFVPAEADEDGNEVEEPAYYLGTREHGYIMNEKLISSYFDGFGAAACMLKYGEDWTEPTPEPTATPEPTDAPETTNEPETTTEPEVTDEPEATTEPENTTEPEAEQSLIEKYAIKFYETTDGHKIAEVKTPVKNGGIHFIYIGEELEAGEVKIDLENENDPVYASIAKNYKKTLQDEAFNTKLEDWMKKVKVKLNDSYIDNYARNVLNINF